MKNPVGGRPNVIERAKRKTSGHGGPDSEEGEANGRGREAKTTRKNSEAGVAAKLVEEKESRKLISEGEAGGFIMSL